MQELYACLATTKNSEVDYLIDKLLRLIMTLLVPTSITEKKILFYNENNQKQVDK